MSKRRTTKEFILEAIIVHGNNYDYSLVNYKNSQSKVKIICPIHGVFEQNSNSHLQGSTCKKCSDLIKGKKCRLTTEQFIEKAKKIHGDRYDYSLVKYDNVQIKVKIICKKHGVFEQKPRKHLCEKQGCLKCRIDNTRCPNFIEQSIKLFGDKFNYDDVDYINTDTKVKIWCNEHNQYFLKSPYKHLKGSGCHKCRMSKGELKIENYLKENNIQFETEKKFLDCKNIKPLPFDFYLPEKNVLIEYDGNLHFKINEYFGGVDGFIKRVKNDLIKTTYCLDNDIILLRIPYWDFNKIDDLLCGINNFVK